MSQDDDRGWRAPGGDPAPESAPGQPPPPAPPGTSPPHAAAWTLPDPRSAQEWSAHPPGGAPPPGPGSPAAPPHYGPPGYYGGYGHHGSFRPPPPEDKPGIIALRPLNLGDIFNGAFSYIRRNPRATLGLSIVVMAVSSALASYGSAVTLTDTTDAFRQSLEDPTAFEQGPDPVSATALVVTYAGALLDLLAAMILTGLLTMLVGHAVLGRKLSLGETWSLAKGRLPAVIGVTLLVSAGLAALFALIVLTVMGATLVAPDPTLSFVVAVVPVLGLLAVTVWLYTKFALATPAVVLERVGPLAGLGRSWRLVRGSWWRIFGILLLAMLLITIIQQLLVTPFTFGTLGASWFGGDAPWVVPAGAASLFLGTLLAAAFTYPFLTGVTVLLYLDLRMRREGLDLHLQSATRSGEELDERVFAPRPQAATLGVSPR